MSLQKRFRLAFHLALALACGCMIYADQEILPWSLALLAALPLVGVAALTEGRWHLSDGVANLGALLVALASMGWVALQVFWPGQVIAAAPLPASLVPFVGPVLMALFLIRLFRPRGPGDFWLLQGMGLLLVVVGCIVATDLLFGPLLFAYLFAVVATLHLRYRLTLVSSEGAGVSSRWSVILGWSLRISLAGMLVFLVTPRMSWLTWDPHQRYASLAGAEELRTGLSPYIDLNTNGTIEVDDGEALTVRVNDNQGRPKVDLSPGSYWRGSVLSHYQNGHWITIRPRIPLRRRLHQKLPDFGPSQYFFHFTVQPAQSGGLVVGEPILFGSGESRLPIAVEDDPPYPLFLEGPGTPFPHEYSPAFRYHYQQVTAPLPDADRRPADLPGEWTLHELLFVPVSALDPWTDKLIRQLATNPVYGLEKRDLNPPELVHMTLSRMEWRRNGSAERIARALCSYLASSGLYTYSLDLRTEDDKIDPVLDFLWNTREGHCERYASALTLMLRSAGIPARVVKGFRGAEHQGDGNYLIRHSHAHAWVEALVHVKGTSAAPEGKWVWLRLDPTPAREAPAESGFFLARLWRRFADRHGAIWQQLIVGYNSQSQAELWVWVKSHRRLLPGVLGLALVLVGLIVLIRRRRPARCELITTGGTPACVLFNRLLDLLQRYCRIPTGGGQTPRELAEAARCYLSLQSATIALADLPRGIIDAFYRSRYGGTPLTPQEAASIEEHLGELDRALRQGGRGRVAVGAAPGI